MNQLAVISAPVSLVEIRRNPEMYPRLVRIAMPEVKRQLAGIIANALLYRGQDAEAEKVAFIANALYEEIMADEQGLGLQYLTMEEVRRVAKRTALDKDTFGISVATLYSALCAYAKGEGHTAQMEANNLQRTIDKDAQKESMERVISRIAENITSTHKIK